MSPKEIFNILAELQSSIADAGAGSYADRLSQLAGILAVDYPLISELLCSAASYISSGIQDVGLEAHLESVLNSTELVLLGEQEENVVNGLDTEKTFFSTVTKTPEEILNSIALRIVQAEPGDHDVFGSLLTEIDNLEKEMDIPGEASESVRAAAAHLGKLSGKRKTGLKKLYSETCSFIEQALLILEDHRLTAGTEEGSDEEIPADPAQEEPADMDAGGLEGQRLPEDTDDVLLEKCISECSDLLERAEHALLVLEREPENTEALNSVFRSFHTIKGSASFLGIPFMPELSHEAESLLHKVREKEIPFTNKIADLALRSADTLKTLLTNVQRSISSNLPVTTSPAYGELLYHLTHHQSDDREADPQSDITEKSTMKEADASVDQVPEPKKTTEMHQRDTSVRIRTDRLDKLIDMVGELVIAQSMVSQDGTVNRSEFFGLQKKVTHAGKIVRDLQDLTLSMRMVPLKSTFLKMSRLVRDLSFKSGKEIIFRTEGEETEIDRNMVDYINDPLVHILRNAVDHGIEGPDERLRADKTEAAHITLSAFSAGGNIIVEIRDDGRGLQKERILAKARKNGLIGAESGVSDREIHNLVFEPGFSTKDNITDLSGRGVGLDVVKRNVESLRGSIDITSNEGEGTSFSLRLPLTLAITDGMLIRAGEQRFIIPTLNIQLSVKPDPADISTVSNRGEMYNSRDGLLPVIRLHRVFGVSGAEEELHRGLLLIVNDNDRKFALFVDELLGQQQVVIKSLGAGIRKVQGVSGGAILGDGKVGLILDPAGLWGLIHHRSEELVGSV